VSGLGGRTLVADGMPWRRRVEVSRPAATPPERVGRGGCCWPRPCGAPGAPHSSSALWSAQGGRRGVAPGRRGGGVAGVGVRGVSTAAGRHQHVDVDDRRIPANRWPVALWAGSRMLRGRGRPPAVVALTVAAGRVGTRVTERSPMGGWTWSFPARERPTWADPDGSCPRDPHGGGMQHVEIFPDLAGQATCLQDPPDTDRSPMSGRSHYRCPACVAASPTGFRRTAPGPGRGSTCRIVVMSWPASQRSTACTWASQSECTVRSGGPPGSAR
jgi:hypothetical protein